MIRLIHTMGGCGGTVLSRCVGVLPGVALLSEVNPRSVNLFPEFHPLYQDRMWLHLLGPADVEYFAGKDLSLGPNFRELVAVLHDRATAQGRHLVIRDYNYIDFVGVPFVADPPRRLTLCAALLGLPTASIAFIRHPVDQWLSLSKHAEVRAALSPTLFCEAYAAFLHQFEGERVYKYEDFAWNPEAELRAICDHLALPFDPSFAEKFHGFDAITGDLTRLRDQTMSLPERKPLASQFVEEFRSSPSFDAILRATGYARLP